MNVYQKLQKVRVELQDKELKNRTQYLFEFYLLRAADFLPMVNVLLTSMDY